MLLMARISALARSIAQPFKIASFAQWPVAARTARLATTSLIQQLATQCVAMGSKLPLRPAMTETRKMAMDAAPTAPYRQHITACLVESSATAATVACIAALARL